MVTEITPTPENKNLITPATNASSPETAVVVKPAVAPESLTAAQKVEIQAKADSIVKALVLAKGSDSLSIEDSIVNVGVQDQKSISGSVALLQERMGNVLYSDNKSNLTTNMSEDISKLQTALEKVNPKDIQKQAMYKYILWIPFFGNRIVRSLKDASNKGMTLQQFVQHLQESLQAGETNLRQDNAQLKVMYTDLESKQQIIQSDGYLAETIMEKLSDIVAQEKDPKKLALLNKVLFKVSTRAQDLRAMENIHEQFFVSIEMTRDNNDMLIATVQRMLTMGMNVVYVSLAIQSALRRQQNVIEAQRGTKEFLGNMILANATAINQHTKEIGDLYKEPVVAMDKLESAVQQLEQAIDATNKLKSEGIQAAKDNIAKLKTLTAEIKDKSGQLPDADVKSIEASTVLQLGTGR
jgi:uncharacterized protein YaaN involved in tellurite resistance